MRHGADPGPPRRIRPADGRLLLRLAPFARPYRGAFAAGTALMGAAAAARMAGPYLIKVAIDGPVARGDALGLAGLAALYLAIQVLEGGLQSGQTLLLRTRGERVLRDLRSALFAKAHRLTMGHMDRTPSGRIVSRVVSDVAVLADLFSAGMVGILGDLVLVLGILWILFHLHPGLAAAAAALLPPLILVSEGFRRAMRSAYRSAREKTAILTGRLHEHLRGIPVVRLFAAGGWSRSRVREASEEHLAAQLRSVTLQALFFPVVELFAALTLALVLWRGAAPVAEGTLTFGALVAFLEYVQRLFRPIRDIGEKFNVLQSSLAATERIVEFLDLPEEGRGGRARPPIRGHLRFEGIRFAYPEGPPVLEGLDLEVEPGRTVALVGPTGAGKSTLIHLVLGFYRPTGGTVRIDGVAREELDPEWFARHVALVAQSPILFRGTLLENIRLGRPWVRPEDAVEAARAVGLHDAVEALPQGYDTVLGEAGSGLSAGQRQLVTFARALAGRPRLLLLDEATSEVDQETEARIEAALPVLLEGRTSLVVAHRLTTVRRAHRIAVLHRGRIRETGTHESLLARDGLYRALYELQLQPGRGRPPGTPGEPSAWGDGQKLETGD